MDFNTYKATLLSNGANLAQVRRKQSDNIINTTFTADPTYKRCKILTKNGWVWEDTKYQKHTTPSILKDEVDYYLQFRPGVHYPLGTYVIVPDDISPEINTPEDPFDQDYADRTQWWLIVGRTEANAYVRYNILKANWDFQWIYNGEVQHCFGCVRSASSYTSGVWSGDKTTILDNITSAWLPDVVFSYGKEHESLGLDDIQSIDLGMRFMISDNKIHPKTYEVSKVTELVPAGIIKLTMKQKPFDEKRDNIPLRICDYYDENGNSLVNTPIEAPIESAGTSEIKLMYMNDDGELDYAENSLEPIDENLRLRVKSYFLAEFSDDYDGQYNWRLEIVDDYEDELSGEFVDKYSEDEEDRLEKYIELIDYNDGSVSLKPSRVKDLIGNRFKLSVSDEEGGHYSSIVLEVEA